jgi:hypothetical protein
MCRLCFPLVPYSHALAYGRGGNRRQTSKTTVIQRARSSASGLYRRFLFPRPPIKNLSAVVMYVTDWRCEVG